MNFAVRRSPTNREDVVGCYRLYFMNLVTGHIDRYEEFDASDDQMAISIGAAWVGDQPIELWCGQRKVYRIEAGPGDQREAAA